MGAGTKITTRLRLPSRGHAEHVIVVQTEAAGSLVTGTSSRRDFHRLRLWTPPWSHTPKALQRKSEPHPFMSAAEDCEAAAAAAVVVLAAGGEDGRVVPVPAFAAVVTVAAAITLAPKTIPPLLMMMMMMMILG